MHKIILGVALTWCCTILNAQSKLVFTYDAQGNQLERKYCPSGDCDRGSKNLSDEVETLASSIIVHPNPTRGRLQLEWNEKVAESLQKILVTDGIGANVLAFPVTKETLTTTVDLTRYASGMYLVQFVFSENKLVVKKIIKN